MNIRLLLSFGFWGACLWLGTPAILAQTRRGLPATSSPEAQGKIYAVIVGISNYAELKDLQFADRDATLFAQYLEKDLGVPKKHIKLFVNEDATRFNIVDELYHLNELLKPNDRVYFYFAGHGDLEAKIAKENAWLLLYKSLTVSYLKGTDFISLLELRQWLDNLAEKQAQIVFVADACHSGGLIGGKEGQEKTATALLSEWRNQTKILSCQANELSLEGQEWGGGRGLFSYHLIEGLQGLADTDNDQQVSLFELQTYLQTQVRKQAAPNRQTPVAYGNLDQNLSTINPQTLLALKEQKAKSYPVLAAVNTKGLEDELLAPTDSLTKRYFAQYKAALQRKAYSVPANDCAYYYLTQIRPSATNDDLLRLMKRNFAAALQEKAMEIITPLLEGKTSYTRKEACLLAAKELRVAQALLGKEHFLNDALEARAIYLQVVADTWEINADKKTLTSFEKELIEKSNAALNKAISLEPNAPYTFFRLGYLCNSAALYQDAEIAYKQYLNILPNDASAYNNLGITYQNLKNYDKAIASYQKAIELDPNYASAYNNLGTTYDDIKNYDKAIASYQKAIELDPNYAKAYYNLGTVYRRSLKDYTKAAEVYNKGLLIAPENTDLLSSLAYTQIALKQYAKAEKTFHKALSLNEKDPWNYYNICCLHALQNQTDNSLNWLEKALQKGFDNHEHIKTDTDLDNIRALPQFKALLQKYFSEKK